MTLCLYNQGPRCFYLFILLKKLLSLVDSDRLTKQRSLQKFCRHTIFLCWEMFKNAIILLLFVVQESGTGTTDVSSIKKILGCAVILSSSLDCIE